MRGRHESWVAIGAAADALAPFPHFSHRSRVPGRTRTAQDPYNDPIHMLLGSRH